MGWVVPCKTHGGHTLWNELERNKYFVMQRHRASDTILLAPFTLLRAGWSNNANAQGSSGGNTSLGGGKNQRYRIIVSMEPWHVIAISEARDDIYDHWEWLTASVVPFLDLLDLREVLLFIHRFFTDLAQGLDPHGFNARLNVRAFKKRSTPSGSPASKLRAGSSPMRARKDSSGNQSVEALDELLTSGGVDESFDDFMAKEEEESGAFLVVPEPAATKPDDDSREVKKQSRAEREQKQKEEMESERMRRKRLREKFKRKFQEAKKKRLLALPGLEYLPEQYTDPDISFNWLKYISEGGVDEGWEPFSESGGVFTTKKQMVGTHHKMWIFKGVSLIERPAVSIFELLCQFNRWKQWDDTLDEVKTIDEIDPQNELYYVKYKSLYSVFEPRDMVCMQTWGKYFNEENGKKCYVVYLKSVEHALYPEAGEQSSKQSGDAPRTHTRRTSKENTQGKTSQPQIEQPSASATDATGKDQPDSQVEKAEKVERVVRCECHGGGFFIEPITNTPYSMVTYIRNVDWKGWMPLMVEEGLGAHHVVKILSAIKRNCLSPNLVLITDTTASSEDIVVEEAPQTGHQPEPNQEPTQPAPPAQPENAPTAPENSESAMLARYFEDGVRSVGARFSQLKGLLVESASYHSATKEDKEPTTESDQPETTTEVTKEKPGEVMEAAEMSLRKGKDMLLGLWSGFRSSGGQAKEKEAKTTAAEHTSDQATSQEPIQQEQMPASDDALSVSGGTRTAAPLSEDPISESVPLEATPLPEPPIPSPIQPPTSSPAPAPEPAPSPAQPPATALLASPPDQSLEPEKQQGEQQTTSVFQLFKRGVSGLRASIGGVAK